MSKVQEALKSAIETIENYGEFLSAVGVLIDTHKSTKTVDLCKSALSEIERCEPVAWVLDHTPNKGYMKVTNVKEYADKEMSRTKESNPSGFGKEYGCYPYDVCIPLCRCDTSPISIFKQREGWVSVDDRLPENHCYVDVWIKSTGNKCYGVRRCSVLFVPSKHNTFITGFDSEYLYISHWMNQPAAPKE